MRCYNQPHRFYCGVDLHARSLYAHVLDAKGQTVLDRDLPASPAAFLDAVKPFRDGLVAGGTVGRPCHNGGDRGQNGFVRASRNRAAAPAAQEALGQRPQLRHDLRHRSRFEGTVLVQKGKSVREGGHYWPPAVPVQDRE